MRKILLSTCISSTLVAILVAVPASAQSSQSQSPAPQDGAQAAPEATQDNGTGGIGDIIVTANRFSETAQKTPLIITALDSKDLAGVSDVTQLQAVTPGVQLGNAGNVTQTFIRGVGSLNATSSQEG